MTQQADLIVTNARVYTCNPGQEWAEAFAVSGGTIIAVGSTETIRELAAPESSVVDAGGRMVMPGLCDVHAHLGIGGTQEAWELSFAPTEELDEVLSRVAEYASSHAPDEWVVGGIVGSNVLAKVAAGGYLAALDEAGGGRPVLLRDDSHHNRWVNSRALALLGVDAFTPDPEGGTYVRDAAGQLTGVLYEAASDAAEAAMAASIADPHERHRTAFKTALDVLNSLGITAVQDAATVERDLKVLSELDDEGGLTAWVTASLPVRPFNGEESFGEELLAVSEDYRRKHVRPNFVKLFLDGVPMTRTSALLEPYICHGDHEDPQDTGPLYWTRDELVEVLERCVEAKKGAKLHATGDGSVRQALDAIEVIRRRHGFDTIFQIAHVTYVDPEDLPRFAELEVIPDASPYIWFPTPFDQPIRNQIPESLVHREWALKDLIESGALVSGGSDWPVVPMPNPWLAIQTLITRTHPDPSMPGTSNPSQRLSLPQAIDAFTRNASQAVGLDGIGSIAPGRSADFIVLDRNLFEIDPTHIHATEVESTYFQGQKVYGRVAADERPLTV